MPDFGAAKLRALMNVDQFWEIIRKSRRGALECNAHTEQLIARLRKLEPQEIIDFDQYMRQRLVEAYRWDIWALAFIINGGCSDFPCHIRALMKLIVLISRRDTTQKDTFGLKNI